MSKFAQVEYIWLDGQKTKELRSKTKILPVDKISMDPKVIPHWGFDGSSTEQAKGHDSDCALKPVCIVPDPIRGGPNILVMCEVLNRDGSPHLSNTRYLLASASEKYKEHEPWFGIEQEYTLFHNVSTGDELLAWGILGDAPPPQGRYYCGVGADRAFGRKLIEDHTKACLESGIEIFGTNAEVMPGQWEFQIGPLGPLEVSDKLWLARWLLHRLGENNRIIVSLSPKPKKGEWNGAGAHTNFSTNRMRERGGLDYVVAACKELKKCHVEHIAVYGEGNKERLTGKHETCDINTFRYGESDRGASVRIPMATLKEGCGYLEDRRPAANMDPYLVCRAILETICGEGFHR